jgi:hypothetical protein
MTIIIPCFGLFRALRAIIQGDPLAKQMSESLPGSLERFVEFREDPSQEYGTSSRIKQSEQ